MSRSWSRREVLAGAGMGVATLGATPIGTRTAQAAPGPTDLDHEQARDLRNLDHQLTDADRDVVDGVADIGLDMTGQQDVSRRLQQAANNGQVVELPPGDYRLNSTVQTGASGWGIRGTGQKPTDVRLHGTGRMLLVEQRGGRNVTFENFTMDNDNDGESGVGMTFVVSTGLRVRDVHHIGLSPREGVSGDLEEFNDQEASLTINITDPGGVGEVVGFVKTSPTEVSGHAENDAALNSWAAHQGICYVRNSIFQNGGGDGATYLSRTAGGWRFDRCSFYNNYANSLRVGGGQSWIRNTAIVVDHANDTVNRLLEGLDPTGNPIIWASASAMSNDASDRNGGLVDNCRIELRSTDGSRGALNVDGSQGGVVVRNTEIVNNTEHPSIIAERPGSSFMNDNRVPDRPHGIWLENVTVTGSADHGVEINGRPADGTAVCVNGKSVEGLPASALGCGTADNVAMAGWATRLLANLGNPDAVDGALPPVSGAGGQILQAIGTAVVTLLSGALLLLAAMIALPIIVFKLLFDD